MNLKTNYTLQILAVVLISLVSLAASLILLFRGATDTLTDLHETTVKREFQNRYLNESKFLAVQVANNLARPLYNYDEVMLVQIARVTEANRNVHQVKIFESANDGLFEMNEVLISRSSIDSAVLDSVAIGDQVQLITDNQLEIIQPIIFGDEIIGGVTITFATKGADDELKKMREKSKIKENEYLYQFILIGLLITVLVTALSIAYSRFLVATLVRPLYKIVAFAKAMGEGDYAQRIKLGRRDELEDIAEAMNTMAHNLEERSERIHHLAYFDHLTGLPNRLNFTAIIDEWVKTCAESESMFALLYLDLDSFKKINDTYGHEIGDKLLCQVSTRIFSLIDLEIQDGENRLEPVVGRVGGDEFMILIETDSEATSAAAANSVIEVLSRSFHIKNYDLYTATSIGIATFPQDGLNAHDLMKRADMAMYSAKESGKKDYRFFIPELDRNTYKKVQLETQLRNALDNGELELWYQPFVSMNTFQIIGAEALIRWKNPEQGHVSPVEFIPIAEETGLINPIGKWIIEEACSQLAIWKKETNANLKVSINISPVQIKNKTLPNFLIQAVQKNGLRPEDLHLEITETALFEDQELALSTLTDLKSNNFSIWLDDFGTGFSSLSHLKKYPVSGVKIDRSFVKDIIDDVDDRELANAVIAMAGALKLDVVAEGIEVEAQLEMLMKMGCGIAQGYYFSKPLPANDFLKKMKSSL